MKQIRFIAIIAAAAITAACTKEMNVPQGNSVSQITASWAENQTKTVLGEDGTSILWSPNDEISVFYNGDGLKFTSINQSPKATTMFVSSGTVMIGSTEDYGSTPYLYGIYPYSSDNAQEGEYLTLTIPANQTAVEGSFARGAFPSIGRSKDTNIAFYNVCGGIRFTVGQSGITKIIITGNNNETLAGKVKVQFDSEGHPAVSEVIDGSTSVTLTFPDSTGFEVGKWYYVSTLPVKLTKGFSVKLYTVGGKEGEKVISSSLEVKRSSFGSVAEIDKDVVFKSIIIDLSATETSNCYIVSEAGYYKFKAVQGNSDNPIGDVKGVKVLWETFELDETPSVTDFINVSVAKVENYIYFSTSVPFIEGNAVIAAYNDVDCNEGCVLWSWHIWLTKNEIKTVQVQDTLTKETYDFMDRNIGAINVSEFNEGSMGTVYQWGRKDAYAGQDYNNGLKNMYAVGEAGKVIVVERKLENCTVVDNRDNSIANPMTVYKQDYSKAGKGNYSWLTTDYSQWNADELKNLWGANGTKSKYDPCPDGYMVAPKEAFDAVKTQLKTAKMITDDSYEVDPSISSKWAEKFRAQNERKVQFRGGQFGDAIFMVSGDISHTLSTSNGISTLQPSAESWSATLDDFVLSSSASYFRAFSVKINAGFPSSTSPVEDFYMSVNSKNALNLAYELPVRCIKR